MEWVGEDMQPDPNQRSGTISELVESNLYLQTLMERMLVVDL